ncbi:MAG: MFS transporter, partial [Gammaproteobacteria bacterium]|nr:MFS transporter [Gammaproteobacteria bacterium]
LIGLTYAIGSILFGILSILVGRLSDKYGRKKFILIGCALGIIYPLLYASVLNIYQYMAVKTIWAFTSITTGPIFMAYLQDILKHIKKQGQYIGIVFSIQAIFGAVASLVGGYLSDKYSFVIPYITMSIIFLLATIIAMYEFKIKKVRKITQQKRIEKKELLFGIKYIFKKPELIFYFINNSAFGINWGIKGMLWPLMIYNLAKKDFITGSIFATMGLVAFIFLLFIGRIVDKIGPFKSEFISIFILAISGIIISMSNNIITFWITAAIFAIGEAINGPAQAVLLTNYIENKYRGEILAIDTVFDKILNTAAPFIAGILLNYFTANKVYLIFASTFWISIILSLLVYKKNIKTKYTNNVQ